LLILKTGQKIASGTLAEMMRQFAVNADENLEDVFFRATSEVSAPPPPPALPPTLP
jgi:hypothetical protein